MIKDLTDKDVAIYLAKNPEFFLKQEDLLSKLKLSDSRHGTVSLLEKQISVMRERQKKTRKQLKEIIEAAERNSEIFDKSRRLILNLISAEDSDAFFSILEKSLKRDFQCKAYALIVFGRPNRINHFTSIVAKDKASRSIGGLMRAKRPTLGTLRSDELSFLFGDRSKTVESAAVLPLKQRNKHIAMLAIGSSDVHYFSEGMETLFIDFIADTLAKLVPRYL